MMGISAKMTRRRRSSGELYSLDYRVSADYQNHLYSCWSGKDLSTPRAESSPRSKSPCARLCIILLHVVVYPYTGCIDH